MGFIVKAVKSVVKAVVGVASKIVNTIVGPIVGLFKPKKAAKASSNLRLSKSLEPEAYRKIVFGRTAAGLDLRFWQVWGAKGTNYDEVLANATHRINGFKELYFEDELAIDANGNVLPAWAGVVSREVRRGIPGEAGMYAGGGGLWNPVSAPFTGVAHMKLAWVPTDAKLPNGVPSRYTQIVEGALVYDPRRDSTVPGGAGSHRINDQSTWEYAPLDAYGQPIGRNNALQVLWYLLGWRITNPTTGEPILVAGRGVDQTDINLATFINAANDAEAAGYYTDLILSTEDSHTSNEDKLTAGGLIGQLIDTGGLWSYHANVDDTAEIAVELTDADVIQGGTITWNEYRPISDQYQQVSGKFVDPSPNALFQLNGYPPVRDANYENLTGLKRRKTQDFEVVQDVLLAQKLARLLLNMGQYQAEFAAPFMYRALRAQAWSIVRYTSERFGWVKLFRVYRHDLGVTGIEMLLREVHPSIWSAGSVTQPVAPGAGVKYDSRQEIVLDGLAVALTTVKAEGMNGDIADALQISWTVPPANVRRTETRYRVIGTEPWETGTPVQGDAASVVLAPVMKATRYEVQARHISIHEVPGPWVGLAGYVTSGAAGNVDYQGILTSGITAQWPYVGDPTGTRPENNATVGAPAGTNVAGVPAQTLVGNTNANTAAISNQGQRLDQIVIDVDDLYDTYGDTASASASASAAAAAQSAAETARQQSNQAKIDAQAAYSAANDAKLAAQGFRDNANSANSGAQSAFNAANTARDNALTYRNQANSFADNASGSASAASGSASNAATSADTAGQKASAANASAVAADTSRGQAQAAQSAAATSASNASGSASAASTSASLAVSASNSAQSVANRLLPDRIAENADFSYNYSGKPEDVGDLSVVSGGASSQVPGANIIVVDSQEGRVRQLLKGNNYDMAQKGWLSVADAQVYRAIMRAKVLANSYSVQIRLILMDALGGYLTEIRDNPTLTTNWQTFTRDYTSAEIKALSPNVAYIRIGFWNNSGQETQQYAQFGLRNVTAEVNAAKSATAAATSASTASASQAGASQSADAANQSKLDAQTARGQAQAAQSSAAGSASDAAGSASTASQQAGLSASARDAAAASASAASGSASNANASATLAGQKAEAANASAISADTSRGQAAASQSAAATSATNAGTSASSAASSQSLAASSSNAAIKAVIYNHPTTFEAQGLYFAGDSGSTAPQNIQWSSDPNGDPVAIRNGDAYGVLSWKACVPHTPGNKYVIRAQLGNINGLASKATLRLTGYSDQGGLNRVAIVNEGQVNVPADGYLWLEVEAPATGFTGPWVRPELFMQLPATGTVQRAKALDLVDVTAIRNSALNASAASTSAASAAASQDAANQRASAAETSRQAADTAKAGAEAARSSAATSASDAAGSASNAATSQSLAVSAKNDAQSASSAANSAKNDAVTAKNDASGFASSAASSATLSSTYRDSAQSVANRLLPDRPAVTTDFANIAISDGTPESRPAWSTANNVVANDTQEGSVLQLNAGVNFDVGMRGWLPVGSGQTFRTFLRAKSFGGNQGVDRRVFIANGSGAYLGVLQFGGTLSQNWQTYTADFTSEQVKAAQPNAAYVRFGFWNGGGQYAQQYARVGLQNVTSEVASAASASASASSASSAATSKNGADTAAAAANQSKLDAQGASSAASGSASAAAGSAAAASGSASSAQQFATLAAYSGSNAANPNPTFTAYANPNGTPDGWQVDQYNGGYHSRASLPNGGYAWRQEVGASNYMLSAIAVGSPSNPSINLDEYWVMEGEVVLEAGTLQGSTIWMRVFNADGEYDDQYYINFAADTDNSGNVPGAGSAGRTYFYNKLVRIRRVNGKYPTHFWLYASSNGSFWGLGAGDYKKMLFKKVAARRANEQEVLAKTAIPSLTASVSSNSAALTTLQGRALAYWQQIAGVTTGNGASAFVELRAEGTYGAGAASTVAMGAREIHLYNQAANGTYSKALSVVTGRVTVYGDLDVGGAMRIGTRRIPIALQSFLVQGSDGQAVSFGADLTNIPKIEPQTGNLPALPSGQSYDIKALGLTSTGFTTRAKIITQGQSSAQNSGAGVASGGTPYYKAHKPSAGDAVDGNYTFSVNGNIQMYVYGGHQQQVIDQDGGGYANLQADCYVKRNGNWQYIGSLSTSISSYGGGSSGMQTFGYYMSGALYCADSIGQDGGGDYEFGMDVYTDNGNITSVNFSGVTYQAQGQQSGETAVSQPITFRVLPQNA